MLVINLEVVYQDQIILKQEKEQMKAKYQLYILMKKLLFILFHIKIHHEHKHLLILVVELHKQHQIVLVVVLYFNNNYNFYIYIIYNINNFSKLIFISLILNKLKFNYETNRYEMNDVMYYLSIKIWFLQNCYICK